MKKHIFLIIFFITQIFCISAMGQKDILDGRVIYNEALKAYEENDYKKTDELLQTIHEDFPEKLNHQRLMLSGNNSYKLSRIAMDEQSSVEEATKYIDRSLGFYERILELDKENKSAAHNLELALLLKEKIDEHKDEEQREQEQNDSEKNEMEQLQEKQQQLASNDQKGSDDHKSSQEEVKKETSHMKEQMSEKNSEFRENMEKAESAQEKALSEIDKQNY